MGEVSLEKRLINHIEDIERGKQYQIVRVEKDSAGNLEIVSKGAIFRVIEIDRKRGIFLGENDKGKLIITYDIDFYLKNKKRLRICKIY